jgi:hypothetical protein
MIYVTTGTVGVVTPALWYGILVMKSPGNMQKRPRKHRRNWIRRHPVALLFLASAGFLILAIFVLPTRDPVHHPGPEYMVIQTDHQVSEVQYTVEPTGVGFPEYRVEVWVEVPFEGEWFSHDGMEPDNLFIPISEPEVNISCAADDECSTEILESGSDELIFRYELQWLDHANPQLLPDVTATGTAEFYVTSPTGFGYFTNGVELAGYAPRLLVQDKDQVFGTPAALRVVFEIPGADSFDWTFGEGNIVYGATFIWNISPENAAASPIAFSATNRALQQTDALRTFVSGAFVGISGGALVGGFQEWLKAGRSLS